MSLLLLVEDNRVTAELMRVRLAHAGHEIAHAANGREALERMHGARPDLVLLETMVPELDGLQLLKQMKRDAVLSSIPVMVVSARAHEDDILAALAAGADDYLTKPFSLRELAARVERALSQGPVPLRIAVQAEDRPALVGEVVSANARGTSVRFPREGAPCFAIGEAARLSMSSPSLAHAIALPARVVSRGEAEPHRVYGFALEPRSESEQEMARGYLNLVGRRNAFRAQLGASEELPVAVSAEAHGERHAWVGRLLDVSIGGVRLALKPDAERVLHAVDALALRFQLPGHGSELTLAAAIRHRIADGDGAILYGVRFDAARSPRFVEQLEELTEFVLARTR